MEQASRVNGNAIAAGRERPSYLAARRVESGLPHDRFTVVPVDEIAYAFRGSVATAQAKQRLVASPWIPPFLDAEAIYLRTIRNSLFLTSARSVEALERALRRPSFVVLNRGVLVNLARVAEIDLQLSQLGFVVAGKEEWLRVSRRASRVLRKKFLLPERLSRVSDAEPRCRGAAAAARC